MAWAAQSVWEPNKNTGNHNLVQRRTVTKWPLPDDPIPLPPENNFPQGHRPWYHKVEYDRKPPKMSLSVEDTMKMLSELWNSKLTENLKHTGWSALIIGAGAFIGGTVGTIAAGPFGTPVGSKLGLAIGGSVGGLLASYRKKRKCNSILQILKELPPAEQEKLRRQVSGVIKDLQWTDTKHLTELVKGSEALQERLLKLLTSYIKKKP